MGTLAIIPSDASAQKVPWMVLPLIVSPVVAALLAAALGVSAKSWSVGLKNTGLVTVWVVWFLAASEFPAPDLVIWACIRS